MSDMPRKIGVLAWLNVVLVGALVLGLVYALRLYPRLNAGQRVVDDLKPAFQPARATGDRTGINFVGNVVNTADPLMTDKGTGAAEVPKLIALVSSKGGLSQAAVVSTLQTKFPHTLALLQAIPLSSVTSELPGFLDFVAAQLKVTTPQLVTTLQTSFPHLYQAVANLPAVTGGWNDVPNLNGLTRFDGTPVKTAPQLQDYFSHDVVPIVEKNTTNFHRVASYFPPVKDIPILLTAIGGIAVLFGLLMMLRSASGNVGHKEATVTWTIVLLLGVLVLGIVFGAQIYPRLDGGSHLLRDATPGFSAQRVAGDRAGVTFVSHVVDMADPIMNDQGKAGDDIKSLLTTLSSKTGLSTAQLLAAVTAKFPHTAALLQAVPLSAVNAEVPGVLDLLHVVLNATPADVLTTLKANVPGITQAIVNLDVVVKGWDNYPGGRSLTRFNGSAVTNAPQLRDYFGQDVVAAIEKTAPDFRKLNDTKPDLTLFPGLLTILGGLVVIYGIIMLIAVNMPDPEAEMRARKARGPGGRRAVGAESG
jgi:hypothetical protein